MVKAHMVNTCIVKATDRDKFLLAPSVCLSGLSICYLGVLIIIFHAFLRPTGNTCVYHDKITARRESEGHTSGQAHW